MPTNEMLAIMIPVMMAVTGFLFKYSETHKKYRRVFFLSFFITVCLVFGTIIAWVWTVSHKEISDEANVGSNSDKVVVGDQSNNTESHEEDQQGQNKSEAVLDTNTVSGDDPDLEKKGVSLEKSDTLYDGYSYEYYRSSGEKTFSVGSGTYNSGFVLTISGERYAFALFDLKGNYSRISFDVGRVNGTSNHDAVMRISIDGQNPEEFNLSASVASKPFEVDLHNSGSLKIEITEENIWYNAQYGFFNVFFEY